MHDRIFFFNEDSEEKPVYMMTTFESPGRLIECQKAPEGDPLPGTSSSFF